MRRTQVLPAPAWLPWWTAAILGVSSFHMLEHVVQTYQAYVLHAEHAHGLLGKYVDSDWVHLAYNALFFVALVPVLREGGPRGSLRWQLFVAGFAWAGYHAVEHSIKTWQTVVLGMQPAPGIVGHFGPLIPLHLWLNAVVYVLVTPHLVAWALRLWPTRRLPEQRGVTGPVRAP